MRLGVRMNQVGALGGTSQQNEVGTIVSGRTSLERSAQLGTKPRDHWQTLRKHLPTTLAEIGPTTPNQLAHPKSSKSVFLYWRWMSQDNYSDANGTFSDRLRE